MTKVGVLHENARISRRFLRKLFSLSSILEDYINDFRIDSFCEWSAHAPVVFNVLCNTEVFTPENTENGDPQMKWKDSLRDQFRRCLIARLADLNTVVNHIDVDDRTSANSSVNRFSEILNEVAKPLFSRENICKQPHTSSAFNNKLCKKADWFDETCSTAKQLYLDALRNFNNYKKDRKRIRMCTLKSRYKSLARKKKRKYEYMKLKEIELLRHKKPKDFWKLFKKNSSKIQLNEFFD